MQNIPNTQFHPILNPILTFFQFGQQLFGETSEILEDVDLEVEEQGLIPMSNFNNNVANKKASNAPGASHLMLVVCFTKQ